MKKIICILLTLLLTGTYSSFAQKQAKPKAASLRSTSKANMSPTNAKTQPASLKSATTQVKKDGTPDKRYKANKDATKTTPKLKKDGTPDMRYKENKNAAKKK